MSALGLVLAPPARPFLPQKLTLTHTSPAARLHSLAAAVGDFLPPEPKKKTQVRHMCQMIR